MVWGTFSILPIFEVSTIPLSELQNSYELAFSKVLVLSVGFPVSDSPSSKYPQGSQGDPSGAPGEFKNVKNVKMSKVTKLSKVQKVYKFVGNPGLQLPEYSN